MKRRIIAFVGHADFRATKSREEDLLSLLDDGWNPAPPVYDFYLGGYGNFDSFALHCCKKYKKTHPDSKIILITPYIGEQLNRHKEYLERIYDEIIYPPIEHVPLKFAIAKRNEWMVEQADMVIAYVDHHYGGAYNTLLHAKRKDVMYLNLYEKPFHLSISEE